MAVIEARLHDLPIVPAPGPKVGTATTAARLRLPTEMDLANLLHSPSNLRLTRTQPRASLSLHRLHHNNSLANSQASRTSLPLPLPTTMDLGHRHHRRQWVVPMATSINSLRSLHNNPTCLWDIRCQACHLHRHRPTIHLANIGRSSSNNRPGVLRLIVANNGSKITGTTAVVEGGTRGGVASRATQ